jgi:uncharacterized Zn-binding protein involved in type VI secretion
MPGLPVSIGCAVVVSPGAAGPPDSGIITAVTQNCLLVNGQPLAVSGSVCQMVNSLSGVPYVLPIGPVGTSTSVTIQGQALVRVGDQIPAGSGVMTILGPPAATFVTDGGSP